MNQVLLSDCKSNWNENLLKLKQGDALPENENFIFSSFPTLGIKATILPGRFDEAFLVGMGEANFQRNMKGGKRLGIWIKLYLEVQRPYSFFLEAVKCVVCGKEHCLMKAEIFSRDYLDYMSRFIWIQARNPEFPEFAFFPGFAVYISNREILRAFWSSAFSVSQFYRSSWNFPTRSQTIYFDSFEYNQKSEKNIFPRICIFPNICSLYFISWDVAGFLKFSLHVKFIVPSSQFYRFFTHLFTSKSKPHGRR